MSSSESNFLWTSASSDSGGESDSSSDPLQNSKDKMKMNKSLNNAESFTEEQNKSKKKKKKNYRHSEDDSVCSDQTPSKKKKKSKESVSPLLDSVKLEHDTSDNESYLNLRIKQELTDSLSESGSKYKKSKDSDTCFDQPLDVTVKSEKKKKRKKERNSISDPEPEISNATSQAICFDQPLDVTVKSEKKKKRKKDRNSISNPEPEISNATSKAANNFNSGCSMEVTGKIGIEKKIKKKKKSKSKHGDVTVEESFNETNDEISEIHNESLDVTELTDHSAEQKDKKKRKPRKEIKVFNGMDIDEEFSAEETVVQSPARNRNNSYIATNGHHSSGSQLESQPEQHSSESEGPRKQVRKISDRIAFEDEETEPAEVEMDESVSNKVIKYAKTQALRPVAAAAAAAEAVTLSPDDDVWLLQFTHNVDITQLKMIDFVTDDKCKIKIDGQKYEAQLNSEVNRVAIATFDKGKGNITSKSLKGGLRFRKKIPKMNVNYDEIVTHEPMSFIPLPETKCRHPLFGSNYKEAIKLPKDVTQRLRCVRQEEQPVTKRKRNKSRHETEEESHAKVEVEENLSEEPKKKKKKKRKHSVEESDEGGAKKRKKIKKESSAATWDSEQGIADTLFNF